MLLLALCLMKIVVSHNYEACYCLSNENCGESISHNCEACCCLLCPQLAIYYTPEAISHPMDLAKNFFIHNFTPVFTLFQVLVESD